MMKQRFIVVGIICILGALYFGVLSKKGSNEPSSVVPSHGSVSSIAHPQKLGELLKAPRADYKKILESNSSLPPACIESLSALQSLNLLLMEKENTKFTYQTLPVVNAEICPFDKMNLSRTFDSYKEACTPKNQNASDEVSEECTSNLFFLRSKITQMILNNKPIQEISDIYQLADLMFAEFLEASESGKAPSVERLKELSARMLELDPHVYAGAKIAVAADALGAFEASTKNPAQAEKYWSDAEASLKRAQEMNPNDPSLDDSAIAVKTRGFDAQKSFDVATEMIAHDGANPRGFFLMAFAQWKKGDRAGSFDSLKRAIELDPKNSAYRKTWEEIHKPGAKEGAFSASYSIGIGSSDF